MILAERMMKIGAFATASFDGFGENSRVIFVPNDCEMYVVQLVEEEELSLFNKPSEYINIVDSVIELSGCFFDGVFFRIGYSKDINTLCISENVMEDKDA